MFQMIFCMPVSKLWEFKSIYLMCLYMAARSPGICMMWVVPEASDTHGYHTLTTREYSRNSTQTRMTEYRSQVRYHLHGSRQRIRPGDSFEVIVG